MVNNQNGGTEMPTVFCSEGIHGQCSTVACMAHEIGQEQGLLLERDNKKYSILSPNVNDICNYYNLSKLSRTASDGMVFTLKPEYRKDVKTDENVTTGTWTQCQHRDASTRNADNKKHVLTVNGVVCRVVFPHDFECDSISRTDDALDQSLETHSSEDPSVFPQEFEDASVSSASSKLDSTVLVNMNLDDTMRMNPFIKAEIFALNSVQCTGSTPARNSVKRSMRKWKEPSGSFSDQTKVVKIEHEERSDTRRRASYAVGKVGEVWTADEEDIVKKKAKFVEKGSCTWSDIARQIRRVGSARSADAVRSFLMTYFCTSIVQSNKEFAL
jgi:hypothetical protein